MPISTRGWQRRDLRHGPKGEGKEAVVWEKLKSTMGWRLQEQGERGKEKQTRDQRGWTGSPGREADRWGGRRGVNRVVKGVEGVNEKEGKREEERRSSK